MDPLLVSGQQRSHRMTPLSFELAAETVYVEQVMFTLLQCLEVVKSSFQPFPSDFEGGLCFLHTGGIVQEKENRMDPLLVSGQQRSHRMTPLSFELAAETVYVEQVMFTLLQCLEVVKSSFQPFPSDFELGLCHSTHRGDRVGKGIGDFFLVQNIP